MTWALAFGIVGVLLFKSAIENRPVQEILRGVFLSGGPGAGERGFNAQNDLLLNMAQPFQQASEIATGAVATITPAGLGTFDGKPVCKWLIPILRKARQSGLWKGTVLSGYRNNAQQAAACAQTSGPCADPGESQHQGRAYPKCAVDVTDPAGFKAAMQRQGGNILKNLVAGDAAHFSHDGH